LFFPNPDHFTSAFAIDGRCIWSTWNRVNIAGATANCLDVDETTSGGVFCHNTFVDSTFNDGVWGASIVHTGDTLLSLLFLHCNFQGNSSGGFYGDGLSQVEIANSYFEAQPYNIYLTGTYGLGVNLHGNMLWGATNTSVYNHAATSLGVYSGNRVAGTTLDWDILQTDLVNSNIRLDCNYDRGPGAFRSLTGNITVVDPTGYSILGASGATGYTRPLYLGAYALWVGSDGKLYIKSGIPTSDTDGTVVGSQT
jgi:hypothetical protein